MGPGGGWNFRPAGGSYVFEQKGLFHGLTWREIQHFIITAAIGGWIAKPAVSIGVGLFHWNYHIFKDQVYSLDSTGPGGGGPGQSLTSTIPPLSLEATGASLTQPGKTEGPARSSKRGSRSRRGPKGTLIKCPRGYHWDKKTGRCLKNRKKY